MSPCYVSPGLTICRPDLTRTVRSRERRARWCFTCRARRRHLKVRYDEILRYDAKGTLINGYYGYRDSLECSVC